LPEIAPPVAPSYRQRWLDDDDDDTAINEEH
jgi:hypothetical protein